MSTSDPRRTKVSKTSQIDLDRLSSLPNPVIFHILSFLPTKYAARTSVLSTMWKQLFLNVPKIILDDVRVLRPKEKQGKKVSENLEFIEFVNRRLLLSKTSSITEFRLKGEKLPELASSINLWLTTLLSRNLEVLEIEEIRAANANPLAPLYPPSELFVCETLGVLKLCGWNIVLKIPQSVYFPKLKVLHLKHLAMRSQSDRFMFSEGYPVLEDLRLEYIKFPNKIKVSVGIVLRSLQKLAIVQLMVIFTIDIDTPHLQHLITRCCCFGFFANEPRLKLSSCESIVSADFDEVYAELLSQVNNVRELRISSYFQMSFISILPVFPKLTNLELSSVNGKTMWIFIQRAPILKSLVYDMRLINGISLAPKNVPLCFADNLREIKLKNFKGGDAECATVRYFLQHTAVLEKMTVKLAKGSKFHELPSSILKQLLEQRRLSPNCQIKFLEWSEW